VTPRYGGGVPHIARFRILRELGRGGFGQVFLAHDPQRNKEVAVKVLLRSDPRAKARFAREVSATTRLRHPNIVAVFESGEHEGRPFLVMDFVPGDTLDKLTLRERALSVSRAAELMRDVARGVAYAHSQGVLHRDLKPDNVLVDRAGAPRLLDFGLALLADSGDRLSRTGAALGTPSYMAPEQAVGGRADERTDVYGLGATLYYTLTGEGPFDNHSNPLLAVHRVRPEPPSKLNARVPPALDAICLRALAKEPAKRYANAEALLVDLDAYLAGSQDVGGRPFEARQAAIPLAVVSVVLALAAGAFFGTAPQPEQAPEPGGATPSPATGSPTPDGDDALARLRAAVEAGAEPSDLATALSAVVAAGVTEPALSRARGWVAVVTGLTRELEAARRMEPAGPLIERLRGLAQRADQILVRRTRLALARVALRRGAYQEVLQALEGLEPSGPVLLLQVTTFQHMGRWARAKAVVERGLTRLPRGLWHDMLELASSDIAPERRRALFERLRSRMRAGESLPPEVLVVVLGADFMRPKATRAARRRLEQDLRDSPIRDEAHLWLTLAAQEALADEGSDPDHAQRLLERAKGLTVPYELGELARAYGQFYLATERPKEAIEALDRAQQLLPEDPITPILRGLGLNRLGRYGEATQAWREGAKRDRVVAMGMVRTITPLAFRLRAERVLGLPPVPRLSAQLKRSIARRAAGFPEGPARAHLQQALELTAWGWPLRSISQALGSAAKAGYGELAPFHTLAAELFMARGDVKRASSALKRSRELAPISEAYQLLTEANLFSMSGELAKVLAALRTVVKDTKREDVRIIARAWLAWLADDNEGALKLLDSAPQLGNMTPAVVRLRLLCFRDAGRTLEALKLGERALLRSGFGDSIVLRLYSRLACHYAMSRKDLDPALLRDAMSALDAAARMGDHEALLAAARSALLLPRQNQWFQAIPALLYDSRSLIPTSTELPLLEAMLLLRNERPRAEIDAAWRLYKGKPYAPYVTAYRSRFGADPPGGGD
jgi:tetratricopeptide (TPR) repeat protein/predicted Ser/Thr protein kinase